MIRTKKIKGGKLLRVEFEKQEEVITKIKITGDFFIYPEDAIEKIENIIRNSHTDELEQKLDTYIQKSKIELIGFTVYDVVKLLQT